MNMKSTALLAKEIMAKNELLKQQAQFIEELKVKLRNIAGFVKDLESEMRDVDASRWAGLTDGNDIDSDSLNAHSRCLSRIKSQLT